MSQSNHTLLKLNSRPYLPVIHQTEAAECGLACLAMVAHYHGYRSDLNQLRRRFSISNHGINLKQLIAMAGKLNLIGRALQLDLEHLPQLQLPCIIHWDMNHFVVLKSVSANKAVIHDPASGEKTMSLEEFANHFTGIALELTPSEEFVQKEEKQRLRFRQLWSKIIGLKRYLIQILVLSVLLQLFTVAAPFYLQTIVDDVLLRNDYQLLMVLAVGFGLVMLIKAMTEWLRDILVLHLSSKISIQMAANIFRHLIRLPLDYFEKRHMGDIVSRFGSLNEIKELLSSGIVAVIVDGALTIVTLVVMFYYSKLLASVVLLFVAIYSLLRVAFYRPVRTITEASIVSRAKENSNFMETLRAIQSIKVFSKEHDRQNLWQNRYAEAMNKEIQLGRWVIGINFINNLLFGLENIIVIYLAAEAVMGNIISLGMLYAFMSYKSQFTTSVDSLITKAIEIKMLSLHLERLSDIALTPTDPSHELSIHSSIEGTLSVKSLCYRYSEEEPEVFKNLNFTINDGESVVIVGPSGCGKSTLLKCLMGLFSSYKGSVLIGDTPIEQSGSYRSQIAAVMQDDQLISGSIADNIAFSETDIDFEWLHQCASIANIHNEIMEMPMNYNTFIGDMGSSLSGGQKQRLLLARALYRKPKILFLDEATSHLDIDNENIVNDNIKKLDITRIIVAHRKETINSAERIIRL